MKKRTYKKINTEITRLICKIEKQTRSKSYSNYLSIVSKILHIISKRLLDSFKSSYLLLNLKAPIRKWMISNSAPYTPELNGSVQCENRSILEMADTFKYSNLDLNFPVAIWVELVMSAGATYSRNRLEKSSIDNLYRPEIQNQTTRNSKFEMFGYLVRCDGDERAQCCPLKTRYRK